MSYQDVNPIKYIIKTVDNNAKERENDYNYHLDYEFCTD